jgi:predicted RNase H-like HicB family nuclease
MTITYPVAIHKDVDSDFGMTPPDLLGCISAGATIAEATEMIREAMELHLEGMLEEGDPIPEPTTAEQWLRHEDYADAVAWAFIEVDVPVAKATQPPAAVGV